MFKKLLCLNLAILMIATMLPISIFAKSIYEDSVYATLHKNDGSGETFYREYSNYDYYTDRTTLNEAIPKSFNAEGKYINSFNTAPDGSGIRYELTTLVTDVFASSGSPRNLFAQWTEANNYFILYDGNGASKFNGETSVVQEGVLGETVLMSGDIFIAPEGKRFLGWSTTKNGAPNYTETYNVTENTVLYAIWGKTAVVYHKADGSVYTSVATEGLLGWRYSYKKIFIGWNSKEDGSGVWYDRFEQLPNVTEIHLYQQTKPYPDGYYYVLENLNDGSGIYSKVVLMENETENITLPKTNSLGWVREDELSWGGILGEDGIFPAESVIEVESGEVISTISCAHVEYRDNRGENKTVIQYYNSYGALTLTDNRLIFKDDVNNLVFDSWNTKADGSGTKYVSGDKFDAKQGVLYAQWRAKDYTAPHVHVFGDWQENSETMLRSTNCVYCGEMISYPIADNEIDFGSCGSSIVWSLSASGVLELYGSGSMPNYDLYSNIRPRWYGETKVTSVIVHDGITTIGNSAFAWENSLRSVKLPDSVTYIGDHAFVYCYSLKDVTLPKSLKYIGVEAFVGGNFRKITLPENLEYIGRQAFGWTEISKIHIPASVKEIALGAFGSMNFLCEITVDENNKNYCSVDGVLFSKDMKHILHYPASHGDVYVIPAGVEHIEKAFSTCSDVYDTSPSFLRLLVIPDSVTRIANDAFKPYKKIKIYGTLGNIAEQYANENKIPFKDINNHDCIADVWEIDYSVTPAVERSNCILCNKEMQREITQIDGGTTSKGLEWSLDSVGLLIINGSGVIRSNTSAAPWIVYASQIRKIVIGEGITELASAALTRFNNLKELELPSTLESIHYNAIRNKQLKRITVNENNPAYTDVDGVLYTKDMTSLVKFPADCGITSYAVPEGVTSIEYGAFWACSALAEAILPSTLKEIGEGAFSYSKSLESIVIPEGVTSIEYSAFQRCEALESVTLPATLETIGENAFLGCISLKEILIPEGVTNIEDAAFSGCTSLESVALPSTLESISWKVFASCQSLKEILIPEGVTKIGYDAFYRCTSLTSVTLPATLEAIDESAFLGCISLKEILIPEGVASIEENAFYGCTSLTSVTLPSTLKSIGENAFGNCDSLCKILLSEENPCYSVHDNILFNKNMTRLILYPCGKTDKAYRVPDGVMEVCIDNSYIESLTLPKSVNNLDVSSLEHLESLCKITVEDGNNAYKDIDGVLFSNDLSELYLYPRNKLGTEFAVPSGVERIGEYAFYGAEDLTDVTLPDTLGSIGDRAFRGCESLKEIVIPNGVTEISDSLFYDCVSLVSVTLPEGMTNIGDSAFTSCSSLKSIELPSTLESIGYCAFLGCEALESIVVPEGIVTIYDSTFNACYALKNVTLPSTLEMIEYDAFSYCESLKEIVIPEGVTSIYACAFQGCFALTSVTLPSTLEMIEYDAFSYCESLEKIIIPESVTYIGGDAFDGCDNLTIYGKAGSAAEEYAAEYGIPFVEYVEHEHSVDSWEVQIPAEVGKIGSESGVCTVCGETVMRNISEIGDADGDGELSVKDVLLTLNAILNSTDSLADMNGDGVVNIIDVIRLLKLTTA